MPSLSNNSRFEVRIGAEARIDLIDWQGSQVIRKHRIPKSYRSAALDRFLRKKRTREEVDILFRAKTVGVACPKVFFADPKTAEIYMEFVHGSLLRDIEIQSNSRPSNNEMRLAEVYANLGRYAARLHSSNIIHGDLTTKNVIVSPEKVTLIDFGLSFISDRIEDKAEELHLLKQALRSTNDAKRSKEAFKTVIEGYSEVAGKTESERILEQIAKIEKRGRYARVD